MTGGVQIRAAQGAPGERAAFAQLLALSMGRPLESAWGRHGRALADQLFGTPGAAQSGTCTWFALVGDAVGGLAIAFPAREFEARSAETRRVEAAVLPAADRCRLRLARGWRSVRRAALGPVRPDALYLEALAVLPSRRRRGVASALLQHACTQARGTGHRSLDLDVAVSNREARRFYAAQGCAVASRRGQLLKVSLDLAHREAPAPSTVRRSPLAHP